MVNIDAYSDALVVLGTAGVVPIVRRLGVTPVLAYLGAGALVGPFGLGSLIKSAPILHWFTVVDAKNVEGFAELGIVFLLFLIGLELSYGRLMAMRRLVFRLGILQVLVTTVVIAGFAVLVGYEPGVAMIVGTNLSLSSTAIVLELLSSQRRLTTSVGRASFSILIAQDLAVIPILLFISILGSGSDGSILTSLTKAVVQAVVALAIITAVGRLLLRPLFRLVGTFRSSELFIAAVLFVIIGAGVIANQAGLSMALGAFVAGLLLAETEYVKAIEATVEPFKGLLLGIFFFTVGMNIDYRELVHDPRWLLLAVLGLVGTKAAILVALAKAFRLSWMAAVETGLLLGPGGEFAFVGIGTAMALGLIDPHASRLALAVTSVTMALTPILSIAARRLASMLALNKPGDLELTARPMGGEKHAIVVGYGRVGKVVCALFEKHGIAYLAADSDAPTVSRDRREGHKVYYGNGADPRFLKSCGLMEATGVIVTIHSQEPIDDVVEHVRVLRPDILIVSLARDAEHASHLYAIGATDAVPETIEASLQLSEASLVGLGVATGAAIASIHEKRDEFRRALQAAAHRAGRGETRSVRAKTSGQSG
jgi:monovalent cation:H+ antiporter-2, CPA2 family